MLKMVDYIIELGPKGGEEEEQLHIKVHLMNLSKIKIPLQVVL